MLTRTQGLSCLNTPAGHGRADYLLIVAHQRIRSTSRCGHIISFLISAVSRCCWQKKTPMKLRKKETEKKNTRSFNRTPSTTSNSTVEYLVKQYGKKKTSLLNLWMQSSYQVCFFLPGLSDFRSSTNLRNSSCSSASPKTPADVWYQGVGL